MYKKDLCEINEVIRTAIQNGKKCTLLYRDCETVYYAVSEYVVYLEEIIEKDKDNFSRVRVRFANNETYTCSCYLEETTKPGDIISLVGYMLKNIEGSLNLYARGGYSVVVRKPKDIEYMLFDRSYRMGIITNLSYPQASTKYPHYVLKTNPTNLTGRFYYFLQDWKVSKKTDNKGVKTYENGGIDILKMLNIEKDDEDIPDDGIGLEDSTVETTSLDVSADSAV